MHIKSKYTIIILILLLSHKVVCQSKSDYYRIKLLYVVDSTSNNYMVPYIEDLLHNLRFVKNTGNTDTLFTSIKSLNVILEDDNIQASLLSKYISYKPIIAQDSIRNINRRRKEQDSLITASINDCDNLLRIRINIFKDLIEFQFTNYKRLNQKGRLPKLEYLKSSSIFVNPVTKNYKNDIEYALKQVFNGANYKPRTSIIFNKEKQGNYYYYSNDEEIKIDIQVNDNDSPLENRSYHWAQNSDSLLLPIEIGMPKQIIKAGSAQPGHYKLLFKTFDGISYSLEDTLEIIVYKRPVIKISPTQIESKLYNNVITTQNFLFGRDKILEFPSFISSISSKQTNTLQLATWLNDSLGNILFYDTLNTNEPKSEIYFKEDSTRYYKSSSYQYSNFPLLPIKFNQNSENELTLKKSIWKNYFLKFKIYQSKNIESSDINFTLHRKRYSVISLLVEQKYFPFEDFHSGGGSLVFITLGPSFRLSNTLSANLTYNVFMTEYVKYPVFTSEVVFDPTEINFKRTGLAPINIGLGIALYQNPESRKLTTIPGFNVSYKFNNTMDSGSIGIFGLRVYIDNHFNNIFEIHYSSYFHFSKIK